MLTTTTSPMVAGQPEQRAMAGVQGAHGRHVRDPVAARPRRGACRISAYSPMLRATLTPAPEGPVEAKVCCFGREGAARDILDVGAGRLADHLGQVGVLLDEARHLAVSQAEHVLPDQYLGVAVRAGADPDRRDVELGGDPLREVTGHHLHHHAEGARPRPPRTRPRAVAWPRRRGLGPGSRRAGARSAG